MHELVNVPAMLGVVAGYLVLLVLVGAFFYKRSLVSEESRADFLLAGRSLGKLVTVGTIFATYVGGGTVTGGGNSLAYKFGFWPGVCFAIAPIFSLTILYFLAERIRESRCYTTAELLEKSYGSGARRIAAVIIAIALVSIVSYQYRGLGFILNATTGISVETSTAICAVLVIALAFSGGLKTVATTDAMSAFLMVFGMLFSLPILVKTVGGLEWVKSTASPEQLSFLGGQSFVQWIGAYLPLMFLTIGDQNYFQRICAAKDLKTARVGLLGCMLASVIVMPIVACFAFIGRLYFGSNIVAGQALISTATLLPIFWGGVLLAAASAFTITTGDSYLLSASSNFTVDLYAQSINPQATEKQQVLVTRWFILIAGVVAYVILQFFPSILAIQFMSYTIYGAAITPAVLCALLWKGVTKAGGIASMLLGSIFTIVWELQKCPFGIQTVIVALPLSFVVIFVVSFLTQPERAKSR